MARPDKTDDPQRPQGCILTCGTVHGFNVRDKGLGTTDTLEPFLLQHGWCFDKDSADYGFHHFLRTRWGGLHYGAILRIAGAMVHWDAVISHSNGHVYTEKALKWLEIFLPHKRLLWFSISPARDPEAAIPSCCEHLWVYATPHDKAVKLSRWRPRHHWGEMGAVGYKGPDQDRATTIIWPQVKGHSEWFRPPQNVELAGDIYEKAAEHYASKKEN